MKDEISPYLLTKNKKEKKERKMKFLLGWMNFRELQVKWQFVQDGPKGHRALNALNEYMKMVPHFNLPVTVNSAMQSQKSLRKFHHLFQSSLYSKTPTQTY